MRCARRRAARPRPDRRRRLLAIAGRPGSRDFAAELVLAADQFIITPAGPRGRGGARPRRRRGGADRDRRLSLVHRLGPRHDDQPRGADALHRPLPRGRLHPAHLRALRPRRPDPEHVSRRRERRAVSHGRRDALVLPRARPLRRASPAIPTRCGRCCRPSSTSSDGTSRARASASASIPADGLLRQGAEGYQLTWMDAKVDDWVVTPRRGKAVEINALWYNALRLLDGWMPRAGRERRRARISTARADRARDVVQPRASGTSRPAISSTSSTASRATIPPAGRTRSSRSRSTTRCSSPSAGSRWCTIVRERLLTPVGLRSLAPGHPDYKAKYYGDLRSRDAAYHQGTVWGWLIGPFVDAWLKVHPDDAAGARQLARRVRAPPGRGVRRLDQRDLRRRGALHAARLRRPGVERGGSAAVPGEDRGSVAPDQREAAGAGAGTDQRRPVGTEP